MASWLEQYIDQLDAINASSAAYVARTQTPKANAYEALSRFGNTPEIYNRLSQNPINAKGSGIDIGGAARGAKKTAINFGMGALDLLMRGNYASANIAQEATQGRIDSPLDVLKAAWGGVSGQKKTTYSDVLREQNMTGPLGGLIGLGLDIGLDPTTYVGVGAVKTGLRGVLRGAEKATGKNLTKLGRAKNAISTKDVVEPGDLIAKDADETVKVTEPQDLPYDVVPEQTATEKIFGYLSDKPAPKIPEGAKFFGGPEGIEHFGERVVEPTTTQRIALQGAETERNSLLQGVSSRRYAPDLQVEPLRVPHTEAIPETKLVPNPKVGTAGNDVVRNAVNSLTGENLDSAKQFNLWGRMANNPAKKLAPSALVKMIKDGKVPKALDGMHLKVNGKKVPIKQYVDEIHQAHIDADINESPFITELTGEVKHVPTGKSKVMSPSERAAWIAKHKEHLDPDDMKVLIRAANLGEGQFKKAFEKIKNRTVYKNYDTLEELEAAQKAGMISDTGRQVLTQRAAKFGGAKTIGAAYRRAHKQVEKFQKALDKASENPTAANKAALQKAQQEAVKAEEAAKFAGREHHLPDPVEEIMKDPRLVDNAAQNIENLMEHGEAPSGWTKVRAKLTDWQAKVLEEVIPETSAEEMKRAAEAANTTATGAKREVAAGKKGPAWHLGWNKRSQFTLGNKILARASNKVASMGVKEVDRSAAMYDLVMPMLEASDAVLRKNGVPIILGQGARGLPMSLHDALSALPRDFVEKYFFSGIDAAKGARSADFTQMADVIEQYLMKGLGKKTPEQVRGALEQLFKRSTRGRGKGTSALNVSIKSAKDMPAVIKEFDSAFAEAGPKIMEALRNNSVHAAVKEGQQTKALTETAMLAFHKIVDNPNSTVGQIIRASLDTSKTISEASKLMPTPPSVTAHATAEVASAAHVATQVDLANVKVQGRVAKAVQDSARSVAKLAGQLSDAAALEAVSLIEKFGGNTLDLGTKGEFGFGVRAWRTIAGHLGNENLRPILMQRLSVNQTNAKRFSRLLNNMNSKHTPEALAQAFRRLQMGEEIDNPVMQDLWTAMKELFDTDPEYGILKRNAITAEELQAKFDHFKIPDKFKLDPNNLDASWKTWTDVEDPLNLLSKFNAAVFAVVSEKELGAEIGRLFGQRLPGATGKWVKITDTAGKSRLHKVLDPDLYFPEDIARQMHMIDTTLDELAKGSWNNSFFKVADSVTHAYKAGVTIYRPGHHARNLFGDLWLSSMDGVSWSAYKRGFAAIATASDHYKDFDALRSLQAAYVTSQGVPPKTLVTLRWGGKDIHLSPEQIYRMAYDNGVLPDYSVLEDIAFGTTAQADRVATTLKKYSPLGIAERTMKKAGIENPPIKGGQVHNIATTASEYRDHYVRLSHFIHSLDQMAKKGKSLKGASLEDALMNASHEAAGRVRKWHPDGSDLTHMEKNVMRRGILFYSWVRKVIPLVVESMVTNPGKVSRYPKAMQNWAYANGINLEGQTGFPEDQLFPNFIADGAYGPTAGEAGSYFGVQPGIPAMDILNEYGGAEQTLNAVGGGLNPGIRVPAEVLSRHQLRTGGGPIMDKSDYIDQLIPGGNYIDKLLGGRSISTLGIQPNRVAKSNVGYEPDFPMGKGGMDFLNWLTGIGITDYSVPSYQKAAQIQQGSRGR